MIANHVKEGKNELNFANWDLYIPEKKHELLDKISEVIEEYEMPLGSYLIFHSEARLSDADKELLKIWAADQVVALESIEK
jgi:hypothetical protein